MDFNVSTTKTVVNPYRKTTVTKKNQFEQSETVELAFKMGIQSQLRNGSIQSCRKKAKKRKQRYFKEWKYPAQYFVGHGGKLIFAKHIHCEICRAKHKKLNIPHRSHHKLCTDNKRSKGIPQTNTERVLNFHREREKNNSNLYLQGRDKVDYSNEESKKIKSIFFQAPHQIYQPPDPSHKPTGIPFAAGRKSATCTKKTASPESPTKIAINAQSPSEIRELLDKGMEELKNGNDTWSWTKRSPFPPEITIAIATICAQFYHHKPKPTSVPLPTTPHFQQALDKYNYYFKPGTCTYQFLPQFDNQTPPSPHYHSIVGELHIS